MTRTLAAWLLAAALLGTVALGAVAIGAAAGADNAPRDGHIERVSPLGPRATARGRPTLAVQPHAHRGVLPRF